MANCKSIPVQVELRSTVYHLYAQNQATADGGMPIFIGGDQEEVPDVLLTAHPNEASDTVDCDTVQYTTDGILRMTPDAYVLTYLEDAEMGLEGCETTLRFPHDEPSEVQMSRTGESASSMLFSMRNPRCVCVYNTPIAGMSFTITIHTRRSSRALTDEGGHVELDYTFEMHGACTERTVMHIQITPKAEESSHA